MKLMIKQAKQQKGESLKRPKYVIFDCDGVLVDSEILANRVEVEIKNQLGIPITLEEQIKKFTGCAQNHPDVLTELQRLPKNYLQLVDSRCDEVYRAELKAIAGVVDTLKALNLPKCVASSSEPDYLEMKLNLTNLKHFFPDAIFHGRLVAKSKPEPDLFLHAVNRMGWKPEECLVIEDSEHGVKAGRAAGMIVCGFLGGAHNYPGHADRLLQAGADYIISDIKNILRLTSS
jgi:HAD superfamily hydrolase (TIGR01509 family)